MWRISLQDSGALPTDPGAGALEVGAFASAVRWRAPAKDMLVLRFRHEGHEFGDVPTLRKPGLPIPAPRRLALAGHARASE